jgi:hypothetical protein
VTPSRQYVTLTADERQQVLRRLKHGPDLPREDLAEFARRVRREVLAARTEKTEEQPEEKVQK